MTIFDPVIGESRTKVGETTSTNSRSYDPVIGTTATKVGETYTQTGGYGSSNFGSTYYHSRPRAYRRIHSDGASALGGVIVLGVIAICAFAILASSPATHSSRSYPSSYSAPRRNDFFSNSYSSPYRSPNLFSSWGERKCDLIEICKEHLSGRKSGCYTVEENCRWVY